ncbi:hypothetical protein [Marinoscillum furvescens]|uniref:cGAS/DncV-like nucleotidyltransferase C-terminal helical domain-containing protein n=1 Tax=Marinoscillum furvescens DSM 4134 TaxID=1122208 RepID=A0A3D9KX56_MARFU|nr:hypothetical protein [Marinoscillum furvescens]RED93178.1 hypothetical protein C7460_12617 [Marinoscillum furvescens DSM 4134]
MNKDYSVLLENLLGRRYDEALRESIVSDAFHESEYSEVLKYALEAMEEIDPSYAYKTYHIAKRIQERLEKSFDATGVGVDFRYQGPIQTETHIVLYGGVELIILARTLDKKPWIKVENIATHVMQTLSGAGVFTKVDYSTKERIILQSSKPSCEVKILPAIWLDNPDFISTKREIDRGICEYNLDKKTRRKYLPFLNIARVNAKDQRCNGGLKKMIRLLSTLQRDANDPINLSNYEISSVLYAIPDKQLKFNPEYSLSLLGVVGAQLNRVLADRSYRETLISPSEKERVFGTRPHAPLELEKLKAEFDALVSDLNEELKQEKKTVYSDITY